MNTASNYVEVSAIEGRAGSESTPGRRRLRVAVLSYGLPVEGSKRGGIERVADDLAHGLSVRGHDVTVWSYDPPPAGAGYRVRPLPWRRFATSWLGLRLTMGYLGNILLTLPDYSKTDAIVAMGDCLLLPLVRRPVIRVMHGSALGEALSATSPWRFGMQLGVYVQELLTGILQRGTVAVSENTRRHNPFVRRVIPNGVDLSRFRPAAKSASPTILFVGALEGRKRGRLLLKWFQEQIHERHPDARLLMVGPPGPPVDGVEYRTGVSAEALAELYASAWVYASPSRYEGFGLPYIEAMASGTPVVATRNPGSEEVLANGRYGMLVGDEEFAESVCRLITDQRLREEMSARGLQRAAEYGLERMLDGYEALLYERIADAGGPEGEGAA